MTDIEDVTVIIQYPIPKLPTYIGQCCREWIMPLGGQGRCGICGERPTYLRDDT